MDGKDLSRTEAAEVMNELTNGDLHDAQIAAFLTALNMKGFTSEEIAGCAEILRAKRIRLDYPQPLLDTCGTGGDGLGTFNISSFTALICAACGVKVAKHGNRAVSSLSGSADFYRALGINIDISPEEARILLDQTSFTFMFAPYYHGAMRYAASVRRGLGMKTIMNVLGPLANPAEADYQLLGVYDRNLLKRVARAAKALGVKRILTVHGQDGEDEISAAAPTEIFLIDEEGKEHFEIVRPEDFGFHRFRVDQILGGTADENAAVAKRMLSADIDELLCPTPSLQAGAAEASLAAVVISVLLNSGAALFTAGAAESIAAGVEQAKQVFRDGTLRRKTAEIVKASQVFSERAVS
ncbi:MAG: anthranilate phosphoribosyltransferase [Spirochaetales bacterium]|jgi:anthranilate synthase/phosphoribosyltransferase|nr:anthranilate phosphoribosyltransferase [Spirochaetales bacterium]